MSLQNALPGLTAQIAGSVKAVYRGTTGGATTVTLPAPVNANKTLVISNSKGSVGTVAARGNVDFSSMTLTPVSSPSFSSSAGGPAFAGCVPLPNYTGSGSGALSGGTTDLTVKVFSAVLNLNGLSITTDGPVEYQVIEFH